MRGPCPNRLRSASSALALLGGVALLAAALSGGAMAAAPGDGPTPDEVATRVRDLEARVRAARERLLVLVSTPRAPSALPLRDEPELRELARELPALESELEHWARLEADPGAEAPAPPGPAHSTESPESPGSPQPPDPRE